MKRYIILFLLITGVAYASYQPIPQIPHLGTKKSNVVDLTANDIQLMMLTELMKIEKQLSIITGETITDEEVLLD